MKKYVILMVGLILITGCGIFRGFESPMNNKPESAIKSPTQELWQVARKSNWMVTLAIPIIAFGAVAAFNGMAKLGMSAAIFGCINLFLALATARFALVMAVFGLIGSCAVVAASVLRKNRALTETITGIQQTSSKEVKEKLQEIHSKTTQKLVQNIKTNLRLKGKL